ncbi:hypothetical protein EWM64_g2873 [Hericium alpestre]|uniref:MYND-type domain-containing protein n=1 Tax=Hericium alpestre TaxID=135208 RepID=A0A4Z0A483_9AGAM|nr:hypothetical protein EWM64_g2873 [Hericium alpestre]
MAQSSDISPFDCVVIGSGNAGSCAALSAVEHGCTRVLIVDKCPKEWVGGNGFFTAGAHRTVHGGLDDLLPIVTNVPPGLASKIDVDPYTADDFHGDIHRLCGGKSDPALAKAVVDASREAIAWLAEHVRVPFTLAFNRQAYEVNGRQKFWGGLALSTEDGGKGLIRAHEAALARAGVEVWFDTPALELTKEGDAVTGVIVQRNGQHLRLESRAVVLAAGGYESSPEVRAKYIGHQWDKAKVRGTPYNTGDGIRMAAAIGAKLTGDYEGCHATCWDANALANTGDRTLSNQFTKSGYPLGIMVNANGERFVDEGEDFRNFTYAKFGKAILRQPGSYAFQIWDSKMTSWLRKEEYGDGIVEKIWADSVEELADKLRAKGLQQPKAFVETVTSYNDAVQRHQESHPNLKWDPAVKDGVSTQDLPLPKSNWALTLQEPPFLAVKVACGITFTFGGVAIDPDTANVLSEKDGKPIQGLFCTGEMVGGLWVRATYTTLNTKKIPAEFMSFKDSPISGTKKSPIFHVSASSFAPSLLDSELEKIDNILARTKFGKAPPQELRDKVLGSKEARPKAQIWTQGMEKDLVQCAHCDKQGPQTMKTCSHCKLVRYCDKDCQRAAWSMHKPVCKAAAKSSNPAPAKTANSPSVQTSNSATEYTPPSSPGKFGFTTPGEFGAGTTLAELD